MKMFGTLAIAGLLVASTAVQAGTTYYNDTPCDTIANWLKADPPKVSWHWETVSPYGLQVGEPYAGMITGCAKIGGVLNKVHIRPVPQANKSCLVAKSTVSKCVTSGNPSRAR